MINKERLQELINNNAEIIKAYHDEWDDCDRVKYIKISPETHYIIGDGEYTRLIVKKKERDFNEGFIVNLFETEEDYEEFCEFGKIVRQEKLELPFWNELKEKINIGSFGFQNIKNFDNVKLRYKKELDGKVTIFVDKGKKTIFAKKLTRENYNKARNICKKLFLKRG